MFFARAGGWDSSILVDAVLMFTKPGGPSPLAFSKQLVSYFVTCAHSARMFAERPTGVDHSSRAVARMGCGPAALGRLYVCDFFHLATGFTV